MSTPQRLNSPNNEQRTIQLPVDPERGIGLATVVYARNGHIEHQSRHFQDDRIFPADMVASRNERQDTEGQDSTDINSECSLFDDGESQEQAEKGCHCYRDTEVDESSSVFNGDVVNGMKPASVRKHHMHGGSVKRNSRLVNGDLDRQSFLAFFCRD
ncbi:hypothetical protein ABOM_003018 [Aspergillus bombycis]|uniref:Uncharacterized protein n=1 Tax=Aspergillus bombycis TaxID=109264 RepID=A0A1F8AAV0_9EURO|nr:hypothetical protein ABOM_003018 [Aspergillus bombycis]OGM48833.1 hypothetical protein ABOM_003018 [Aspergillus bombycis]